MELEHDRHVETKRAAGYVICCWRNWRLSCQALAWDS